MPSKFLWLAGFLALYGLICLTMGLRAARRARPGSEYVLVSAGIPAWVFVPALTAASFAGWLFTGHPGQIYKDGFSYAYVSLFVIAVPLTGAVFFGRLWTLSRHFDFVTPGEMFAQYFRSEPMRFLVAIVALGVALPFLTLTLNASGVVLNILSEEALPVAAGVWVAAGMMYVYVGLGGFRAVTSMGVLQALLLGAGVVALALIVLNFIGGWDVFLDGIAALAKADELRTPQGYSHYLAMPGISGEGWTALRAMTALVAFMGLFASPAFLLWAFAARSSSAFAPQQVLGTACGLGILVVIFMTIIGIGGHFLGADLLMNEAYPDLVYNVLAAGLGAGDLTEHPGSYAALVPLLVNLMGQMGAETAAALSGFLALCALAAMQAAGGTVLHSTSVIASSDGVLGKAGKWRSRLAALLLLAVTGALAQREGLSILQASDLALGTGLQMWPALLGVCFLPWFTKQGIAAGLVIGLACTFGLVAMELQGTPSLWDVHAGVWGLVVNFTATVVVSALSQGGDARSHRMRFHEVPAQGKRLGPMVLIVPLVWLFFAAGPGAMIGNTVFGNPNDAASWLFSMPSIWIWQLMWWGIGVLVVWYLVAKFDVAEAEEFLK